MIERDCHPPGPRGAQAIRLFDKFLKKDWDDDLCSLYSEFGPIVFIPGAGSSSCGVPRSLFGMTPISSFALVVGPAYARLILSDPLKFPRGLLNQISAERPDGTFDFWPSLAAMDGKSHLIHRQQMMQVFKPAQLAKYSATIDSHLKDRFAALPSKLDVHPYVSSLILEIICRVVIGVSIETPASQIFMKQFNELMALQSSCSRLYELKEHVFGFLEEIYHERIMCPGNDAITVLAQCSSQDGTLTKTEVLQHVYSLLDFGISDLALMLTYAIGHIARQPDVQQQLRRESVNLCDYARGIQPLFPKTVSFITEVERLHPPVRSLYRYVVTDFDCEGYVIPAETVVIVAIELGHLLESVFERPREFLPFRHLEGAADRGSCRVIGFGHGSHSCVAKQLCYVIATRALLTLLRSYTIASEREVPPITYQGYDQSPSQPVVVRLARYGETQECSSLI